MFEIKDNYTEEEVKKFLDSFITDLPEETDETLQYNYIGYDVFINDLLITLSLKNNNVFFPLNDKYISNKIKVIKNCPNIFNVNILTPCIGVAYNYTDKFIREDISNPGDILFSFIMKSYNTKKFLYIPLDLESIDRNTMHANAFIYNPYENAIEHYEPHGPGYFNLTDDKTQEEIGEIYFDIFYTFKKYLLPYVNSNYMEIFNKMKYICPNKIEKNIGLQGIVEMDAVKDGWLYKGKRIRDPGGYCSLWCIFFYNVRILFPKENIKGVNIFITSMASLYPDLFFNFIRLYGRHCFSINKEIKGEFIKQHYDNIFLDKMIKYYEETGKIYKMNNQSFF